MSETAKALSETAMRASLSDIDTPGLSPLAPWADLALALGLGGAVALGLVIVLRGLSRRRVTQAPPSLQDRIEALQTLPEDARRLGFLHLLREVAPTRFAALRPELYRPGARHTDPEAEVLSHARPR